ncbi:S8 family serine peptidase [Actinoplanes xinjiangensis]|uniref:Subtilase family protein n=1 Tax=Actinoplanes xinjiangensis TaxID=512350 RepID=A0A316F6G7_9ACTN|nr:S8 family serine peptidase [Actinoplanes xinjiangensis]PWK39209.1 subtilase family protein [Actinoplanes xinjiangensis]GIF43792.1 hypothetical protein Axi01nite_81030 [Actinoplanes xinjiangensis]
MRIVSSCLVSVLLVGSAASPAMAAEDPVLINVGLVDSTYATTVLDALGDRVRASKPVRGLSALRLEVPAGDADSVRAELSADETHVRFVETDGVVHADSDPYDRVNREPYTGNRVFGARTWGPGSPDVTVAVVDTGVSTNDDLPAARITAGYDFVDEDADPLDDDDHGTMVATVIAAEADNGVGASGICPRCRIMPVRVLGHRAGGPAEGSSADAAAGIVWAADHGAQVINLSLSTATPSRLLAEAVAYADGKGSLVVAAAGNAGATAREFPAAIEPVIAVGATANLTVYSNTNSRTDHWVDIAAEQNVHAMDRQSRNRTLRNTSGAAAVVAGVAALGIAAKEGNSAARVRWGIVSSGANLPPARARVDDPKIIDAALTMVKLGATDTVAPVLTDTGLTSGQVLSWRGTPIKPRYSDDHAVQRVEQIVDGRVVATADQPWEELWAVAPHGTRGDLPVTVRVTDYAGNHAEATTVVTADAMSPAASVVSPAPGSALRSGPVDLVVRASEDSVPIESVRVGGTLLTRAEGTRDWTGTVQLAADAGISVNVRGGNGLTISLAPRYRVDDTGPTATSLSPAHGTRVRGVFTSGLGGVTDVSGPVLAELWADGVYAGLDHTAPYGLAVRSVRSSGPVQLYWRLTDQAGNIRTYTRWVTADYDGPAVTISRAPSNKAKIKGTTRVYVKASDASGIARVELTVNGKVVARDHTAGYMLAFNASKSAKAMKVQVRAYDRLGNVRYTSTRTWYRK